MKYKEHRREIIEAVDKLVTLVGSLPENKPVPGHEYIEKYSRNRDLRGHWVSYAVDMLSEYAKEENDEIQKSRAIQGSALGNQSLCQHG